MHGPFWSGIRWQPTAPRWPPGACSGPIAWTHSSTPAAWERSTGPATRGWNAWNARLRSRFFPRRVGRSGSAGARRARSARRCAQPSEHLGDLRYWHARRLTVHRLGIAGRRDAAAALCGRSTAAPPRSNTPCRSRVPWPPRRSRASSIATSSQRTCSSPSTSRWLILDWSAFLSPRPFRPSPHQSLAVGACTPVLRQF
jgi:hypothetical protein